MITTRTDKSQVVNYNNPLFYCFADKHSFSGDKTFHVVEHWHEDIEYLHVVEGKLHFTVNGEKFLLSSGEGVIVNSKRIHENHSEPNTPCTFYCMIINPTYLNVSNYIEQKFVAPILSPNSFDYLRINKHDWTAPIVERLENLFEHGNPNTLELEILETTFATLRYISQNVDLSAAKNSVSPIYVNTFKDMMTFISEKYAEKITLEDIANAGNVGKTLCTKIFKKYVSDTPGDYLIKYRVQKSIGLLTSTDLSITDIAYASGFTSASYYTKTFRELIGYTPNKYRNTNISEVNFRLHNFYTK